MTDHSRHNAAPVVAVSQSHALATGSSLRRTGFIPNLLRGFERVFRALLAALERLDYAWLNPWLRLARNREFWRFVRFLATGSLNFAFYYSLFTILHLLHVEPVTAVISATVVAVLFNFCTTGRFVFGSGRIHLLPRFIGVYAVQCAANIALLRVLMAMDVPVLIAEALVIGLLAVATFFALRRFVFSAALMAQVRR